MKIKAFLLLSYTLFLLGACKKNSSNSGTCSDGILNQNETSVDCGGKCSKCATCSDGIQNQGESAVDCGGPCGNCPTSYPAFGNYGGNILRNDTITIKPDSLKDILRNAYSMCAIIGDKSSLRVVVRTLDNNGSVTAFSGSQTGWYITNQSPSQKEFYVNFPVKSDIHTVFIGHSTAIIDMYENGAITPTRTKTISW
ncbi:hypothetical protein CNR22_22460 [Sphingobacteriaceae bacterium]|nr:hypothetical protein CNR22_22460 [Sphingobacteriaceae bacterium]